VPTPLPFGPCVAVQSAVKFLNLTVPGSAGSIALSIRFLQKQGAETGEAVASGAIVGLSDTIVQILLIVCLLPFVRLHFDTKQLSGALPSGTFVAVIFAILAVAAVAVLTVPALRRRVVPQIRSAFHALWEVARSGHKLMQLFGGSLAAEVLFALTLGAASRAYGIHLALAQLILVNVVASSLAGLVPVPGGIGAAELRSPAASSRSACPVDGLRRCPHSSARHLPRPDLGVLLALAGRRVADGHLAPHPAAGRSSAPGKGAPQPPGVRRREPPEVPRKARRRAGRLR
jgi:hypothetical protein